MTNSQDIVKFDEQSETDSKKLFGFWVYLMTDLILFSTLFATYAVLHNNTAGGPSGSELFKLPYILVETLLLLTSSFTCGLALLSARSKDKNATISWFAITFLLGLSFLVMELLEFNHLYVEGSSWATSGFLSSYFTLVGTHGLHITFGLIWMAVILYMLVKQGFAKASLRKIMLLSMFWHFLDIVWIFIFTIVYLLGAVRG